MKATTRRTPVLAEAALLVAALATATAGCSKSGDQGDRAKEAPGPTTTLVASSGTTAMGPDPVTTEQPAGPGTTSAAVPAGPATTDTTTAAGASAAGTCRASQLGVTVRDDLGAGAGHQYRAIMFTNNSAQPCTLAGFPGVSLLDTSGTQVGPAAERDVSAPKETVTIAPGASVSAPLDGRTADLFDPDACGAAALSASVRVYPPESTESVVMPLVVRVCPKDVHQFVVRPVQAGSDSQS